MSANPTMTVPPEVDDARLSVRGFRVLAHLCRRAAEDPQTARTATEIMLVTRLNRKGAQLALEELIAAGFAVRECRPRTSAVYRLAGKRKSE